MRRLLSHLFEPRSIFVGFTTFYFGYAISMWNGSAFMDYYNEMLLAIIFLTAAVALAANRRWSNLVAAILSGQLPLAFLAEFWMLAKHAEVTPFSSQHIQVWLRAVALGGVTPFLWLTVSAVILSYSVVSICSPSNDHLLAAQHSPIQQQ